MSRRYRLLLINPWIYDIAAHDFWIKPLGLLYLAALLEKADAQVELLDCLDRYDPELRTFPGIKIPPGKKQGTGKYVRESLPMPQGFVGVKSRYSRYGFPLALVQQKLSRLQPPDLILMTSAMTYWYPAVTDLVALCKQKFPKVPIILGGIYASLCTEHAIRRSGADLVFAGEAEQQLFSLVRRFLPDFTGDNPGASLDDYPFPAYHLYPELHALPILTSRGCPFHCSFCASQLLAPKFRRRSPENVVAELCYFARKRHIRNFTFYDDALLVDRYRHVVPILQGVIAAKLNLHFHAVNGLHPRYIDDELAQLLVQTGFVTIRLSFETAAPEYQSAIDHKVNPDDLANAIDALARAGFPRKTIEVYIISALPDQSSQQTLHDLLLVHGLGVKLHLAQFSPIPGTTDWQKAVASGMDPNIDLIYTNNSIFAQQWGEESRTIGIQKKLQLFARILNYAIDLDLPLSGADSMINKVGLEKIWFSE